jgi:hypothetical protein
MKHCLNCDYNDFMNTMIKPLTPKGEQDSLPLGRGVNKRNHSPSHNQKNHSSDKKNNNKQ